MSLLPLIIFALIGIGGFVGVFFLQIYLSKSKSKLVGLILPFISFLFSILPPINMYVPDSELTISFVIQMIMLFFILNLPTLIFLAIYFSYRKKYHRSKLIDKMNIQDLS